MHRPGKPNRITARGGPEGAVAADEHDSESAQRAVDDMRIAKELRRIYYPHYLASHEARRAALLAKDPPRHAFEAAFETAFELYSAAGAGLAPGARERAAAALATVAAYRAATAAAPPVARRSVHGPFGQGEWCERLAWAIAVKTAQRRMRARFRPARRPSVSAAGDGSDVVAFILAWNDGLKNPRRGRLLCRRAALAAAMWDSASPDSSGRGGGGRPILSLRLLCGNSLAALRVTRPRWPWLVAASLCGAAIVVIVTLAAERILALFR